jgi:hypothetical protein
MLIMVLIAKTFSQDACGIDYCILIAGDAAEGGFGIGFMTSKNSPSIRLHSYSLLSFHPKLSLSKMSTSQKFEYKAEGYGKQWDPTTSIMAYFTGPYKFRTSLADQGLVTSVEEMTMRAGAKMWESEMFTEDQMFAWENTPAAQQTWQALQDYFMEMWLERRQYSQATAKHSWFKDTALVAQEQAAAGEEGKTTAMMFALLQEQHKHQMEAMAASSPKAMDAMMEWMNAIVAGHGKAADKENTQPVKDNAHSGTRGTKRNKKNCIHCGKHVFHKLVDCYELEANASKHWTGWKSEKDNSGASA